ncbi:hypothetical protein Xmau_02979 [Xenorhabdus mauleonii]|uniref:Filamentous hemagglutinin n=2 Tax=Xenorhabdus mauleonii TaxID=351675 RepID=A0A1I3T9H6_9GAMM|nr:hypothetical protein Xmau_02979 [Xenorhabdus mauleonii]SFJ66147.1 filamentous hemagglutinin [Xenorhabdus mauleonii]
MGDCSTLSPEACGKAKELSQRILDKGLPSVEDMRGKLASCQDDSCRKGIWTEYRRASDATINTLKQKELNGELSREELAFINNDLDRKLAVSGYRANDKLGRSEQSSWLNGGGEPLSGFFNTELRQKERENAGLSPTDAAQYVKEEQRNLMVLETAAGVIGAKASNKVQTNSSSKVSYSNTDVWKGSVVQSRVNVRTGDSSTGSGLDYAWKKHGGNWGANKSHFTVNKDELKVILQSDRVVTTPVHYSQTTGNYMRFVDMGRPIGIDAKSGGNPTSVMTVITDKKGNLVNTFPGRTSVN